MMNKKQLKQSLLESAEYCLVGDLSWVREAATSEEAFDAAKGMQCENDPPVHPWEPSCFLLLLVREAL